MGRINKNDISGPTPLVNTNNQQQQASANDGNGNQASGHRASFQASNVNAVSGQRQQLLTSVTAGPASLPPPPAIQAFQDIRLDASASVAGGPMDPRVQRQHLPPPKMTMRQLQGLVQAVGSYRRQIQALSAASEMFVRSLEDVLDVLPSAEIRRRDTIGDLDFLIDSTHLISNSHQIWAQALEREFEQPLVARMSQLSEEARVREANNRRGMEDMVIKLRQEEEHSYKLGKKKQRDIDSLQSSLSVRMTLADEIKRLSLENQTMADTLAHYSVEHVLEHCGHAVRSELENFDRVMEGLKKLGAFQPVEMAAAGTSSSSMPLTTKRMSSNQFQQQQQQQQKQQQTMNPPIRDSTASSNATTEPATGAPILPLPKSSFASKANGSGSREAPHVSFAPSVGSPLKSSSEDKFSMDAKRIALTKEG